jgi:alanine dehydrogenase
MKIALTKERKTPPDKRVVLPPDICQEAIKLYPELEIKVEKSPIRTFKDNEYIKAGFTPVDDVSDCDVILGVKEVPIEALIPNKKYFFFLHTIKKQPYNQKLLRAILEKNIEMYDHEVITAQNNLRLIGFGYYAGIVGAYNGIRTYGLKYGLYEMPKSESLHDKLALINEMHRIKLPNIKIVLTGTGRVGNGAKEMLDAMYIKQVSVESFLSESFDEPVYVQLDVLDYNRRKDGVQKDMYDFFDHPEEYDSDFKRFTRVADFFIAGHYHNDAAPDFYTLDDTKESDFKIRVVADISCDIGRPISSTLRASTIADPIYGYNRLTGEEMDYKDPNHIAVMAVDNLPAELPKDASEGFGEMFLEHVIPAFFDGDSNGILYRARMTQNGKLTERYSYLQDYVDGTNS